MEKIEILIGKSQYSIDCKPQEREKLTYLSRKLSARIARLSAKLKDADDKTLLIMAALIAEDELEKKLESSILEDEEEEKISDNDLYDAIAENMENITTHLEKLTEKIKDF
jgi:cell division protein ZapA (FtsZ GTPase activity inhibitor)